MSAAEVIAEALLGAWETPQEVAAHVVSRLSDAGYSIVPSRDDARDYLDAADRRVREERLARAAATEEGQ